MKNAEMWAGLLVAASLVATGAAIAEGETKPRKAFSEKQLAQQQRMTDCSADAKEKALKGSDRMAFMKTCLAGGTVTAEVGGETASAPEDAPAAQREKMKSCDAEAEGKALKGGDRKTFVSECLAQ